MNLPEIKPYEEQAIDTVVSVINRAKEKLGIRLTLRELAHSRDILTTKPKVSLTTLRTPLPITSEEFISDTIEKKWSLTKTFSYIVKYMGASQDECSQYYYFEAVFSQPTAAYPIPQATASVFFRVQNKHTEPPEMRGVPLMTFRIEGQHTDHDVRYIRLTADWILAVIKMKTKLFDRIEKIRLF
ncbi:uncharacterized protein LOC115446205 [Manduca sexta]|uniref:A-kinase anchor protein 14 n=1 Tax=Manduca sexta TaxID=7130 RepID=A0A921ZAQ9_MANSE|nr:uncharacterized protein LOC115446205 [Manduca sexta]KAG6454334.1 hypothetical protein O3G_MSEX008635 [Manduca sexta]